MGRDKTIFKQSLRRVEKSFEERERSDSALERDFFKENGKMFEIPKTNY